MNRDDNWAHNETCTIVCPRASQADHMNRRWNDNCDLVTTQHMTPMLCVMKMYTWCQSHLITAITGTSQVLSLTEHETDKFVHWLVYSTFCTNRLQVYCATGVWNISRRAGRKEKHIIKQWNNSLSLHFNSPFPGGRVLADTGMSRFLILLELRAMEVVVITGAIKSAKL